MSCKVLFVFGTRPEAIKLAPVVLYLKSRPDEFDVRVCVTAQHREMLDQVLELFGITPDVDLNLMKPGQDLFDVTANVVTAMKPVLRKLRPDWVLVQGDTTTVWTGALAAFYEGVRVAHIEAGLRTFDKRQPFPEEINRRLCTQLTDLHLPPTERSRQNLLREQIPDEHIVVTGNTVVDALLWVLDRVRTNPPADVEQLQQWVAQHVGDRRMVLITGHRRESFGQGFENICQAIAELAEMYRDVHWVYPVHLNPNVQEPVRRMLDGKANIHLLAPQPYAPFSWLMQRSTLILTDSGGIQEEAPSLGKPVLVMRNTTERPEGVEAGCVKLVGNERDNIVASAKAALTNAASGEAQVANPYGDGKASERIAQALLDFRM
ncbi:MAG: UDP-N-acetylglucosamine 2-epimerase (non-hydrolyzing) [Phycisphaerae bacterium]|nr:UDP-N-acetylglucosamine 2-epimerase (non-hydrolyzing) [Phycisphaerae bacterium]